MGSRIRFVSTLMVAALVFVVVMLVMGVRLDTHTIDPQPSSAQETSRQELALRVHALTKTSIANEAVVWEKLLGVSGARGRKTVLHTVMPIHHLTTSAARIANS